MASSSLSKPDLRRKPPSTGTRVSVLVPLPFPGPLDYLAPMPLEPGDLVTVPLGRRETVGCVWETDRTLPADFALPVGRELPLERLRPVVGKLDVRPLPQSLRRFIDWVAAYTLTPPGLVLAMATRIHLKDAPKPTLGWVRTEAPEGDLRITPARRSVLNFASSIPMSTAELGDRSGASAAVIRGLATAGLLREAVIAPAAPFGLPDPAHGAPKLSEEQAEVAQELCSPVEAGRFQVTLLEGVTGSGKTEVYFEAVAACLAKGKQVLVLLPEIALSAQWTDRFIRRFGAEPAIWHSDLGAKRRRETWRAVAEGNARVVVGARSALFLPFADLGLVVVDEEHESAFKQEEGVMYHGRDMAVVRARLADAPAILVSATPSLETLANVESGRYRHELLTARHGGATLPDVSLVDMRADPPERGLFLSPKLCTAIDETLEKGEQAMLFLNRRGYAPLTLCRACGHRMQCPNCSAWLVEHRARGILTCHHCGHNERIPKDCPECHAENSLVPIGPGIERITEEAKLRFPEAKLLVMSSDTLGSPAATAEAVRKISDGEVNLIIGTQIVAKGWHFPKLTLVGVVDADLGLGGGDLRAAERTVQLLHQVAGRAGRAEHRGRVLLQSYVGEHPVMTALVSNDFQTFMEQEAEQRRPSFWPPYGRLAALIVSAPNADAADALAREIALSAPEREGVQVLGPAPAPLAVLRGRHRRRLLLRTMRGIAVQPILRQWLGDIKPTGGARVDIDIDPISFL
ncbi:primosomal protein N' [Gluconobacter kanchanaburiensis]|uniref:Replication restart protein PriA n=1 Tax=Gluconobacter kanchanaburiensis NBRC 103587 TaxID=1307948 RepID=A0A511B947_9PROT|nr:primosomal protein N' [Gluconobacter kanchanaburiensis]MBF0862090.1 primosomal protein N' [Gluconobacter kanchanaburiensis]GEK96834.1 primosomal protein N' [Gluconobacter kanchanaburiensis NBRC 103587]